MSESVVTILLFAVALIGVGIVIAMIYPKINMGKQLDSQATESLATTLGKFDDPSKQAYEGMTVMGSEVIELAKEYCSVEDCGVMVISKSAKSTDSDDTTIDAKKGTVYSGANSLSFVPSAGGDSVDISNPSKSVNSKTINKNGVFKGYLRRDADGVITVIAFVQQ